jgi:hypothetical protein
MKEREGHKYDTKNLVILTIVMEKMFDYIRINSIQIQ